MFTSTNTLRSAISSSALMCSPKTAKTAPPCTENPVDFRGTYPLPEAQMDRFAMQFTLGYVSAAEEVAILTAQEHNHPLDELQPAATLAEVLALKRAVENIRISEELKRYVVEIGR